MHACTIIEATVQFSQWNQYSPFLTIEIYDGQWA